MTDLFLIAHKVRGKVAWDVAERMTCVKCSGVYIDEVEGKFKCDACDEGVWWILSTVGHRAYPFLVVALAELRLPDENHLLLEQTPPEGLRDFYSIHDRQVAAKPAKPQYNDNLTLEDLGL